MQQNKTVSSGATWRPRNFETQVVSSSRAAVMRSRNCSSHPKYLTALIPSTIYRRRTSPPSTMSSHGDSPRADTAAVSGVPVRGGRLLSDLREYLHPTVGAAQVLFLDPLQRPAEQHRPATHSPEFTSAKFSVAVMAAIGQADSSEVGRLVWANGVQAENKDVDPDAGQRGKRADIHEEHHHPAEPADFGSKRSDTVDG